MNREREERERRELAGVSDPRSSTATAPPGYAEMVGALNTDSSSVGGDLPPAYEDDGSAAAARGGDSKGPPAASH